MVELWDFIDQETRTGPHDNIRSGHNKQETRVICDLVLFSEYASDQLFPMFSCRASIQGHPKFLNLKMSFLHTGDNQ